MISGIECFPYYCLVKSELVTSKLEIQSAVQFQDRLRDRSGFTKIDSSDPSKTYRIEHQGRRNFLYWLALRTYLLSF